MFKESLLGAIQEKFPKTFETWDGFQTSVMANDREGLDPIIIVGLYNKPTEETPANLHRAFRLDVSNDKIDSGDGGLVDDEMRRVYPEVYAKRDAEDKIADESDEQPGLTDDDDDDIVPGSDRDMYLQQDMEDWRNGNENKE